MPKKTATIIGAGPAGLTAAYELIRRTDIKPVVIEKENCIGGLARTFCFHGHPFDIGPHRFFSKSDQVLSLWQELLPVQGKPTMYYKQKNISVLLSSLPDAPDPECVDRVFLRLKRKTRIFFNGKLFHYPISLSFDLAANLGLARMLKICASYIGAQLRRKKGIISLEDFFISRFGTELYKTFFKDYTEKVWGISCRDIPAAWGIQRIKKLSLKETLVHALKRRMPALAKNREESVHTSLVEEFYYPKYGAGQMWDIMREHITKSGGTLLANHEVTGIDVEGNRIARIRAYDARSGIERQLVSDYYFSSIALKDFFSVLNDNRCPNEAVETARTLLYRDLIVVGAVCSSFGYKGNPGNNEPDDSWIYIQEKNVRVGRITIFNNWHPYHVPAKGRFWLAMEYFCTEGDAVWRLNDEDIKTEAKADLSALQFADNADVEDMVVIRQKKAYPAYFGSYARFSLIRHYADSIDNLFLIGRNGMHRYNNMDHSMLTAMTAVDCLRRNIRDRSSIWNVNTGAEYAEQKDG